MYSYTNAKGYRVIQSLVVIGRLEYGVQGIFDVMQMNRLYSKKYQKSLQPVYLC